MVWKRFNGYIECFSLYPSTILILQSSHIKMQSLCISHASSSQQLLASCPQLQRGLCSYESWVKLCW
ncbi:hypothetical protein FGO68_gene8667 [Halteria grandinella]|uniref:Uncharacterized protein n=1 Tax=Halteria grandinella TaxID=5974 RepID=A0A8J8T4I4_HALGN|nr:hypothetical protein FGO68_gene8667 [Halteria grandinella]